MSALTRLQRRIAVAAARGLQHVASPVTVFRTTGVMPYVEGGPDPEVVRRWPEPPPLEAPDPEGHGPTRPWTRSKRRSSVMSHVARVEDGFVLPTGAVFDAAGRFLRTASHDHAFLDQPARMPRGIVPTPHRVFPGIDDIEGPAVSLATSNQDFYFHWMLDVLPRLHLAEEAGCGDAPLYVRGDLPFQRQSLRLLLGGDVKRVVPIRARALRAKELVVPCHHTLPGRAFPAWALRFLRERFLARVPRAASGRPYLHVSRAAAGHRRVTNEEEIVALLEEQGFSSVRLEEVPFEEQVALFRDAQCIVSPHGGGLTNLVFCRPGTQVIELFPAGNIDLYYRLAHALDIRYRYVRTRDGGGPGMGSEDYRIEPEDLIEALKPVGMER